jgi:hypothetical protein
MEMCERSRLARSAIAVALTLATFAGASPATAATPPPSVLVPDVPVVPYDASIVVPTDTVVTPPAPGFVSAENVASYWLRTQMDGPNIAWGRLTYAYTATGPAVGVRVTLLNRQTGWSYSTTTVEQGRYRAAVPNGTYAMSLDDPAHPRGLWLYPESPAPYVTADYQLWGGGLGPGYTSSVVPRPQRSCLVTLPVRTLVVDGLEPTSEAPTECPYAPSSESVAQVGDQMVDDAVFARTGRAPAVPSTTFTNAGSRPPGPPPVDADAPPAPAAAQIRSRTVRPDAKSRVRLSVACSKATRCTTRIVVRSGSRTVVVARRTIPARRTRTVVLRPGPAGRARLRHAAQVRVSVTSGTTTASAVLRVQR